MLTKEQMIESILKDMVKDDVIVIAVGGLFTLHTRDKYDRDILSLIVEVKEVHLNGNPTNPTN